MKYFLPGKVIPDLYTKVIRVSTGNYEVNVLSKFIGLHGLVLVAALQIFSKFTWQSFQHGKCFLLHSNFSD